MNTKRRINGGDTVRGELKSKIKREAKKLALWWAVLSLALFPLFLVMGGPINLVEAFQILLATIIMAPLAWLVAKIGW